MASTLLEEVQRERTERWRPELQRLYSYWLSIRPESGRLPGRQHLHPADICDLLPHLFLIDVAHRPLRFRYRLMGTGYVRILGRDLTGRDADEVHPGFKGAIRRDYVAAVEGRVPSYRHGPSAFNVETQHRVVERVILPMARDGVTVDMLLGIIIHDR